MKTKTLLMAVLLLLTAGFASAQTATYTLAAPTDCQLSDYVCNNLPLVGGGTFHFNTPGTIGSGGFFGVNAVSPPLNAYTNPANSTRFKLVAMPALTSPNGTTGSAVIEFSLSDPNQPGVFFNGKMTGQATVNHRCGIRGCITWLTIESATLVIDQSTVAILDELIGAPWPRTMELADWQIPNWLRWLFDQSEPVTIFF